MCWEEKHTDYPVPTTRHSSWLLDNGIWYWLYCCCCVRITKWGLYSPLLVFYIEPNHRFEKTRKNNNKIGKNEKTLEKTEWQIKNG